MMPRRCLIFALLLAAVFARADSIAFRNGGTIDGVITGETAEEITIKTGPGTATFRKSQLRSILRDPAANEQMQREWQDQHFANPEFLPQSLRPLAQEFRDLSAKQAAALRARRQVQQTRRDIEGTEADIARVQQQQVEIAARLQKTSPQADQEGYNRLARANNDNVARHTLLLGRRQQLDALDATNRAAISAYLAAIASFRDAFERERAQQTTNQQARIFFAKAGEQLAAMTAGLQEVRIPIGDSRGHALVTARINERSDARMLVDTGASFVTLSSASAARMHVPWDRKKKIHLQLANGAKIEAHPVTLESVRVGDVRIESVEAVIIPGAPTDEMDGLLGMSFLRECDVQLDTARNQITLRRLPPVR